MTIIGRGEPTWMRALFTAGEMKLVTEELRAPRAAAVAQAQATHEQHPGNDRGDNRAVDTAHDRLREIDDAARYIEDNATPDSTGRIDLITTTSGMTDLIRGVADRALIRLEALRQLYITQATSTLVACREIDGGPDDPPYLGMWSLNLASPHSCCCSSGARIRCFYLGWLLDAHRHARSVLPGPAQRCTPRRQLGVSLRGRIQMSLHMWSRPHHTPRATQRTRRVTRRIPAPTCPGAFGHRSLSLEPLPAEVRRPAEVTVEVAQPGVHRVDVGVKIRDRKPEVSQRMTTPRVLPA